MTRSAIDSNHHKGLIVSDPITHDPLDVTGEELANARPIHTAIVDGDGNQITAFSGLVPNVDYDFIDVQQTSATVETYIYKLGGAGGTTIMTIVVTYVDATKADINTVEYS